VKQVGSAACEYGLISLLSKEGSGEAVK